MLMQLQHLDANFFHVLMSHAKTAPSRVFCADGVEPTKRYGDPRVPEAPNGARPRKFAPRIYRQAYHRRRAEVVSKSESTQYGLVKDPSPDDPRKSHRLCGIDYTGGLTSVTESGSTMSVNGSCEGMHARRSTKGLSYGGSIPAILQALERVGDLDEALGPWAERLSNKERSIVLKEQAGWERALEIFQWFKKKGCYEANVIHYNIMLRVLGKALKWSLVEALWADMMKRRIVPINSTYGTLIDVYSKGGRRDEALQWLERMVEQGMEADEVTMGTVIQTYKKSGEFGKAEEFFTKWSLSISSKDEIESIAAAKSTLDFGSRGQVPSSSYTYNTLMDTYGKAGQVKEVSETFARMLREGIAPNTVTFNTMIHICGNHGQLEEVGSLMQKMEELQCLPDTRTYNILISIYANHDAIGTAARYFSKMKEAGLEPDPVSYRTLLYAFSIRLMVAEVETLILEMDEKGLKIDEFTQSALTRMYIEAGMLEKSWLWFDRFHHRRDMSSECYAANIDAYGERGHILEAERAFACCQAAGKLSVLELNVMIKAYGISNKYYKACQLFDSMENYGISPDKCSFNSLIQLLAGANMPHLAIPYLRKMQHVGLVTDCIPYCAVISSFARVGQLDTAEELYSEMVKFGVQVDLVVYGVLINAFADVGSVRKALHYVGAMREAGLQANAVICNTLIKLYTKVGDLTEAREMYNILQLSEAGPDVYSSNCMIDLYSEQSMVKHAEEIFDGLRRKGLANEFSFAMMLCMYRRLGWFKEAIQIAEKMRELGLLTDLLSYNNVIGLYVSDSRFREAVETFKEMIKASVQPDDCTFKSLGVVLVKCGVSKKAVGRLETRRKKDAHCGLQAWMSTLSSAFDLDDNEDDSSGSRL